MLYVLHVYNVVNLFHKFCKTCIYMYINLVNIHYKIYNHMCKLIHVHVLKWRVVYIEYIRVVSLMAGLKMEGIVKRS